MRAVGSSHKGEEGERKGAGKSGDFFFQAEGATLRRGGVGLGRSKDLEGEQGGE